MNFRELILHNFWLKAFSVALATVIWLAIHYGIQNDVTPSQTLVGRLLPSQLFAVQVSVIKKPTDSRAYQISPSQVTVLVAGDEVDLRRTAASDLRVFVDLTDVPSNEVVQATVHSEAPLGLAIRDIRPTTVTVHEQR